MKIKFNLNFGGEQIRTLDDLRENFSIEDVLDVYNNGLLVKWLNVRNYKNELEQVKAIQSSDARGILSDLIQIFGVASDTSEIEESLSVLDYLEGRKKFWADIKAGKLDEVSQQQGKAKALREYHEGYNALVQNIVDHPDDIQYIYDQLDAIAAGYPELLKLNALGLYKYLYSKSPLAVMALFGDSATRPYFESYGQLKFGAVAALFDCKSFWEDWNQELKNITRFDIETKIHVKKVKGFAKNWDSWQNVEPAGKKFLLLASRHSAFSDLLLSDADGTVEKASNSYPLILSPSLPILDGISAKNFSCSDTLWYMEAR